MNFTVCAFTGHRNISKKHENKLADILARGIAYAYSKGCRKFLTGGAIGFDTVAAEEIIKFKRSHSDVLFILVIPCKNQSAKWSDSQKAVYKRILADADGVICISDEYTPTCMRERNKYLAENADILLSYVCRPNSGSAQTVRMASALSCEIYNLYTALEKEENVP